MLGGINKIKEGLSPSYSMKIRLRFACRLSAVLKIEYQYDIVLCKRVVVALQCNALAAALLLLYFLQFANARNAMIQSYNHASAGATHFLSSTVIDSVSNPLALPSKVHDTLDDGAGGEAQFKTPFGVL